jgi:hypothetical protein
MAMSTSNSNDSKTTRPHDKDKRFGDTIVTIQGDRAPRLPHERDTSAGSQHGEPTPEVKQAYADVKRGVPDGDVGPPMDKLYHDEFRKPAAKPKRSAKQPAGTGRTAR